MNRKVIYAKLQTEAWIMGAGGLGTVFPSQSKTLEGLTMTTSDNLLSISFTYRGMHKEILIPHTNVVVMEVSPNDKASSSSLVNPLSSENYSAKNVKIA